MSYSSVESSERSGQPIILVDFIDGSVTHRFTNYDKDYVYSGNTYTKSSFKLSNIKQNSDVFKSEFIFTFGISNSFALSQLLSKTNSQVECVIRRGHLSEVSPEFVVIKNGRIIGRELNGFSISLYFESAYSKIRAIGLHGKYEYSCRHRLYKFGCNLNKDDFKSIVLVTSVSSDGLTLTGTGFGSITSGHLTAGMIEYNGSFRYVKTHSNDTVELMTAFNESVLNQQVNAYWGCDRTLNTCHNKFNNSINHGGVPFMPKKNPLDGSLL